MWSELAEVTLPELSATLAELQTQLWLLMRRPFSGGSISGHAELSPTTSVTTLNLSVTTLRPVNTSQHFQPYANQSFGLEAIRNNLSGRDK